MLYRLILISTHHYGPCFDSMISSLLLVFLADCATCGFLYKSHYGRSILHEVEEVAGVDGKSSWVYDESRHKYRKKTLQEIEHEKDLEKQKKEKVASKAEKEKRRKNIESSKREIRAAKVIQRWWRKVLYEPPDGIFYLRALDSFSAQQLVSNPLS